MGFGLVIGFIDHLWITTSSNYNSLTELHTPDITTSVFRYFCPEDGVHIFVQNFGSCL
jgi:hypothetical protein